jgi:hypothetical protein
MRSSGDTKIVRLLNGCEPSLKEGGFEGADNLDVGGGGGDLAEGFFHLTPTGSNLLTSVESHLCEEDAYLAQALWDRHSIRLTWRVIGPQKNEEMEYHYY